MRTLIGNEVKTDYANHVFTTREEAEAFYLSLKERDTGPRNEGQPFSPRQQQASHAGRSPQPGSGATPTRSQR